MLDMKRIKDDPAFVKERLATRNKDYSAEIDRLLALDEERRALIRDTESKKASQNAISKQIPARKKSGEDVTALFADMKAISETIKADTEKIAALDEEIENTLLGIPNLPHESLPIGPDDSANVEIRRWGEPTKFDFEAKPHWELGQSLGMLEPNRAAKVTGTRFHFTVGFGAKLERALMSFFLDTHSDAGYTEILPPFMVNRASMKGTGQLPKFEEDAFKVDNTDFFLIPTAEVPVTNYHRKEILDGADLPICYCAYSACFRAEAGSAGRDTRGLIRQHQFNKVELVKFADPDHSYEELEKLTADAARVLELLGLPYRVSMLCTGDIGFSSAKTYDLEVWMPSYNRYVEISSCSNFEDYQARRADIKFKNAQTDKARLVHTLNGSGVAIGRALAAIMENYQTADGDIIIPEVLRPYLHGRKSVLGA